MITPPSPYWETVYRRVYNGLINNGWGSTDAMRAAQDKADLAVKKQQESNAVKQQAQAYRDRRG